MTSSIGKKARDGLRKRGFIGSSSYGELIFGQCQLKFKTNKDAVSITEVALLKVDETNKIRELYRAICEIPENRLKSNWKWSEELKTNGGMWGGIQEVNSADQIDQLNALRLKMQLWKRHLSLGESGGISESEIPGMRKEIPKEGTYSKYGGDARSIGIDAIKKHGEFARMPFRKFWTGVLNWRKICLLRE